MVDIMRENTASFIIVIFTMIILLGVVYKIYHVNCDPQAVDKFDEFNRLFQDCIDGNCGQFLFRNLPVGHRIVLENEGDITRVELNCRGRPSGNSQDYDVNLCEFNTASQLTKDISEFEIYRELEADLTLAKREGKVCLVLNRDVWNLNIG